MIVVFLNGKINASLRKSSKHASGIKTLPKPFSLAISDFFSYSVLQAQF